MVPMKPKTGDDCAAMYRHNADNGIIVRRGAGYRCSRGHDYISCPECAKPAVLTTPTQIPLRRGT